MKVQLEEALARYGTAEHCSAYIRSANEKVDEYRQLLNQIDEREDGMGSDDDDAEDSESPSSEE